ncbi:hypothetical protein NPS53_09085 [Pseudomonas putida]|uniref:hypothetical protein n=1 Tax=Pseudomonas putida TaxID=303 RepID=UPI00236449E7|nr:hypothetical protein [Pseudomonas putida]MDD2139729.1 hypothetical protein [Pseudomonas putida]HDS1721653.1 hypothetical protein [Pseudomonas putida]
MVPIDNLKAAIDQLDKWSPKVATSTSWVNWRQGFQIKMVWYGCASFACYLDFKKDAAARNAVLKRVFEAHAVAGQKPSKIDGHGWSAYDYSLRCSEFISVNEVAEIAESLGYEFSVLYVQECIGARPAFETLGIPLVPGETGKEWIDGAFVPYSCPMGACL